MYLKHLWLPEPYRLKSGNGSIRTSLVGILTQVTAMYEEQEVLSLYIP